MHTSKHIVIVCTLMSAVLWVTGCQTLNDVIREKERGGGTTKVYAVDRDQAWKIAKTVFRWEGADAIEEHRDERYMVTSSSLNLITAGAVMGAWIEPAGQGQTRVTVVTKRRVATNIATGLTETTFHKRFAQAMVLVKAGLPLPPSPP